MRPKRDSFDPMQKKQIIKFTKFLKKETKKKKKTASTSSLPSYGQRFGRPGDIESDVREPQRLSSGEQYAYTLRMKDERIKQIRSAAEIRERALKTKIKMPVLDNHGVMQLDAAGNPRIAEITYAKVLQGGPIYERYAISSINTEMKSGIHTDSSVHLHILDELGRYKKR